MSLSGHQGVRMKNAIYEQEWGDGPFVGWMLETEANEIIRRCVRQYSDDAAIRARSRSGHPGAIPGTDANATQAE